MPPYRSQRPTTVKEALDDLDENCYEPQPGHPEMLCNRPPFHHGDHVRRQYNGTNQREVARWPQQEGDVVKYTVQDWVRYSDSGVCWVDVWLRVASGHTLKLPPRYPRLLLKDD